MRMTGLHDSNIAKVFLTVLLVALTGAAPAQEVERYGEQGSACADLPDWTPAMRLVLVMATTEGTRAVETAIFAEALGSYIGAEVTRATPLQAGLAGADGLVVYANGTFSDPQAVRDLIARADKARLPVAWVGIGGEAYAESLGLAFRPGPAPGEVRALMINGDEMLSNGLAFAPPLEREGLPRGEVVATMPADGAPVVFVSSDLAYVGYEPLSWATGRTPMVAAVEAVARLFGRHVVDRRVILRLEDLSARRYQPGDANFAVVTQLLLDRGVFMHLGIIPEDADQAAVEGPETVLDDIGAATDLVALAFDHPERVELVQHGLRHWRADPRNTCLDPGCAYEFFTDDDEELGTAAAEALARARLQAGQSVMAQHLWPPMAFEAPHYTMSPAQARVAEALYPLILHPPWVFEGAEGDAHLPWFTYRNTSVYGPSDVGYVAYDEPASVEQILKQLDLLAHVMPDPLATVFFHPFMAGVAGREGDLAALIDGVEGLGYRFVSACDELGGRR